MHYVIHTLTCRHRYCEWRWRSSCFHTASPGPSSPAAQHKTRVTSELWLFCSNDEGLFFFSHSDLVWPCVCLCWTQHLHVASSKYIRRMTSRSLSLDGHLRLASDHCKIILLSRSEVARSATDLLKVQLLIGGLVVNVLFRGLLVFDSSWTHHRFIFGGPTWVQCPSAVFPPWGDVCLWWPWMTSCCCKIKPARNDSDHWLLTHK